jgi:hypothetical protein
MKKSFLQAISVLFLFFLTGCQLIGEVFKAGVWVGVILVVGIVGLILYLVARWSKKN